MSIVDYLDSPRMAEHVLAALAAFVMALIVFGITTPDDSGVAPTPTTPVEVRP